MEVTSCPLSSQRHGLASCGGPVELVHMGRATSWVMPSRAYRSKSAPEAILVSLHSARRSYLSMRGQGLSAR